MKVILTKDVHGLGEEGDIVDIANGYARNYLIPSRKGVEHSTQNISVLKSRQKAIQKRKEEKRLQQMSLKERIEGKTFVIAIKTNDKGHLYGAINQAIVLDALVKEGIEIDKRQLLVPEHTIKSVGVYELIAKFSQNVSATFSIDIVSENYPNVISHDKEEPATSSVPGTSDTVTDSASSDNVLSDSKQADSKQSDSNASSYSSENSVQQDTENSTV